MYRIVYVFSIQCICIVMLIAALIFKLFLERITCTCNKHEFTMAYKEEGKYIRKISRINTDTGAA